MPNIYCDWGEKGLLSLLDSVDTIVIIDILSFTTCVDIVVNNHAYVLPNAYDNSASAYAKANNAHLAAKRGSNGYTLSVNSLINFPAGESLVLPSPNGSTLSRLCKGKNVFAGCLRNASAIAQVINNFKANNIAIIAAGERWADNSLRVAYEDLIGVGAIIHDLEGNKSAEAQAAEEIFKYSRSSNFANIKLLQSGQELIAWGYEEDVIKACEYNVSKAVPYLFADKYYAEYRR
jgi:2-phosphosulfolactate phosphatase